MNIQPTTNKNFTGYGARQLKGFFVVDKNMPACKELIKLTPQTGLDIFTPQIASKSVRKDYVSASATKQLMWGQDYITFLRSKVTMFEGNRDFLKRIMNAAANGTKTLGFTPFKPKDHLRGGNFFITDKNELLLHEARANYSLDELKTVFGVSAVHIIPKLDYHLDLYIRPLKDNIILVADEKSTEKMLKEGLSKLQTYMANNTLTEEDIKILKKAEESFQYIIAAIEVTQQYSPYNPLEKTEEVIKTLENSGYKAIRVPSNYYLLESHQNKDILKEQLCGFKKHIEDLHRMKETLPTDRQHLFQGFIDMTIHDANKKIDKVGNEFVHKYLNNFTNAIVTEKNGELVYITNESLLDDELELTNDIIDKIGFSTKQYFIDSIKDFVQPENIHFISKETTKELFKYLGGIHCTGAEIPV